ncbi:MAG: YcxB family protein [Ruminococcaceae bacterium]|nr:YcxB family protein [Oscillospiraceae bacterium]
MAFCDLKPVCVNDDDGGRTYIIGSVFAVYGTVGSEPPLVYSWDMVRNVSITRKEITIETANKSFCITNKIIKNIEEILRAIAIIECRQKEYGFGYQHEKRMFPLKSMYTECSPGKETYTGEGTLDDGETAAAFIMLLNFKLVKFLWLIALLIMLIVFGILHITIGISRDNILYFVPISIASGGIASLLVYIITHAVARAKFRSMADADLATRQPITFVVSRAGFAACESCTYESRDLVPWSELDYFIESDKMFILYKNNSAVAYIPKKAFDKKYVGGIADIIALSLEQR